MWPSLQKVNESYQFTKAWKYALQKATEADRQLAQAGGVAHPSMKLAPDDPLPGEKLLFGGSPTASTFIAKLASENKLRCVGRWQGPLRDRLFVVLLVCRRLFLIDTSVGVIFALLQL